jgi:uncharacterized protein YjdB
VIATLRLSPASLSMRVGDQQRLTVEALDAAGRPINGLGAITWATSDAKVASVVGNGNVRAEGVGRATITVTVDGRSVSAAIEVQAKK